MKANSDGVISVIGAGYVGLASSVVFAGAGYKVYLVDIDKHKIKLIKKGEAPFYETGIQDLIKRGLDKGNLIPTDSYAEAISNSHIVFSCVGTPDSPDGSTNLQYVFDAANEALKYMQNGTLYAQKSTVSVGTGVKIASLFAKSGKHVEYISNPEFLREGTALRDTLWFDRIVVGNGSRKAIGHIFELYGQVEKWRQDIASSAGIVPPDNAPVGEYIIATNVKSAELTKLAANSFLALKISFANSIAKLADKAGADINEVMAAVGSDPRIGRDFLNAGRGYGGGCFPKDVSGLIASALEHGVDMDIMEAVQDVNASMPGYIMEKLQNYFQGNLKGRKMAILGLSFKAGTSDTRRSPGITLANLLVAADADVRVYDPEAMVEAAPQLHQKVQPQSSLSAAIKDAAAILVATDWPDFIHREVSDYRQQTQPPTLLVDCMNRFDILSVKRAGLEYMGIGRGDF